MIDSNDDLPMNTEEAQHVVTMPPERFIVCGEREDLRIIHRFFGSDLYAKSLLDMIRASGGKARVFTEMQ